MARLTGLTGYSSPVLLVKQKQQNLYQVVTDLRVLNERLVQVNHAFPIVRNCLEAIGASKCEVMSILDLREVYHTLPLAEESQKYCGLTPYYGSPTYIERVLKEWVIPSQAGNKRPKRKCDLSSKIKFLVDRLFIPVSTLYLHSSFALKVQVSLF